MTKGICGAFDLIAFPTDGNLTKSLGEEEWNLKSLCEHLKIVFAKNTGVLEVHVSTCFEHIKQLLLYIHF